MTTPFADVHKLEFGASSHVGRREHNEDSYLIDRALGLVIVADGVGGHQCGEVASAITCESIQRAIAAGADLSNAIRRANSDVLAAVQSGKGKAGMGSTVVAALLTATGYELAWVGDSRIYLWDGKLSLLSRDHSYVEEQLASGRITREEARNHPRRHVILQAVGTAGNLDIGTNRGQLAPGSCLLLCSDGITDPLDSPQLCEVLSERSGADDTCQRLVDAAFQAGGKDNITALLVAHTGNADDPREGRAPDRIVWVYDPATAQYEDPPGVSVRNVEHTTGDVLASAQHVNPSAAGKPAVRVAVGLSAVSAVLGLWCWLR